jgi:hypothetical protein
MSKQQVRRIEIEELPREHAEELTPEEAEEAKGGLGIARLLAPVPPPIEPNVTPLAGPSPPPI